MANLYEQVLRTPRLCRAMMMVMISEMQTAGWWACAAARTTAPPPRADPTGNPLPYRYDPAATRAGDDGAAPALTGLAYLPATTCVSVYVGKDRILHRTPTAAVAGPPMKLYFLLLLLHAHLPTQGEEGGRRGRLKRVVGACGRLAAQRHAQEGGWLRLTRWWWW